jgi:hypothetical protein
MLLKPKLNIFWYCTRVKPFKGRDFVFGNFLTISADLKILKQPNHVKHLRIFSTIFEILKTLPLKAHPLTPSPLHPCSLVPLVLLVLLVPLPIPDP